MVCPRLPRKCKGGLWHHAGTGGRHKRRSQILEQNDYYAFGERINNPSLATSAANRYRYNGKEQLRFEGINLDNDDWIEYDKQIIPHIS